MPKSFKEKLWKAIEPIRSNMTCVGANLSSHPEQELQPDQIRMIKGMLENISGHCQEALEKIAIHNGEITIGGQQNIAPAERRPEIQ